MSTPFARHSLCCCTTTRSTLVLRPPHKPLSVVTTIAPTRFTGSRTTRNGCRYSVFAFEMCIAMLNAFSTYGRVARIRSCAFFIFDAATISIALVILRVLCTLLILFRISFAPAIASSVTVPHPRPSPANGRGEFRAAAANGRRSSKCAVFLEVLDRRGQRLFVVGGQVLGLFDAVHQRRVLALEIGAQRRFERECFLDWNIVEVTLVH